MGSQAATFAAVLAVLHGSWMFRSAVYSSAISVSAMTETMTRPDVFPSGLK